MQIEQTLPVQGAEGQAAREKRDLLGPLALLFGGGLTLVWASFLGWGALSLASHLLG